MADGEGWLNIGVGKVYRNPRPVHKAWLKCALFALIIIISIIPVAVAQAAQACCKMGFRATNLVQPPSRVLCSRTVLCWTGEKVRMASGRAVFSFTLSSMALPLSSVCRIVSCASHCSQAPPTRRLFVHPWLATRRSCGGCVSNGGRRTDRTGERNLDMPCASMWVRF